MEGLSNWEQRLNDYIAAHDQQPFEYGKLDCVMWAAGAVEAVTGVDLAAEVRGTYSTKTGAAKALKAAGADSLSDLMDKHLAPKPPSMAHRGDIVLTDDGNLAVVFGPVALAVGEVEPGVVGYDRIPPDRWKKAWSVG